MDPIVVTRHRALVEYLREQGIIGHDTEVVPHLADPEAVRGRTVIGPVPIHMAAAARSVVHIPLAIPEHLRGVELTLSQVREMAGPPVEYQIRPTAVGYLAPIFERRMLEEAWPGATSASDALDRSVTAWAEAHGLLQCDGFHRASPDVDDDMARNLVALSRLPPPPNGRIVDVAMRAGTPTIAVRVSLGHASSSRVYRTSPAPAPCEATE